MRWSVEVTLRDSKHYHGIEEPQGWIKAWVERTTPLGMLLHSLVVLWFVAEGFRHLRPLDCPWYASKSDPSFADMLATLRRLSVRMEVSKMAFRGGWPENLPHSSKTPSLLPRKLQNLT